MGDGLPTHRDRHGARRLDILAVCRRTAVAWNTTRRWHLSLSDHAVLAGRPKLEGATKTRACTPASLARLPADAWADLRRLGAPDSGLIAPRFCPYVRPDEGALPPWHLAHDICGDQGGAPPDSEAGTNDPGSPEHDIPLCPVVAAYGRTYFRAGLDAWWARWSRRSRTRRGHACELALAARGTGPHAPSEPLEGWLRSLGWGGSLLSPDEAAQMGRRLVAATARCTSGWAAPAAFGRKHSA